MTLQQLEYIVAVDKFRHFAKAAESCGVTQSTLSALVQKMEAELDVTIFDRNAHPIRPTALGDEIINQAKVILNNASQLVELVAARKGESVGKVHLGIAPTIAPYILPKLFKYLKIEHPDIQLFVEESCVSEIITKLERAEIDIALLATPLNNKELLEIPIYKEKLVAYISPDEPLYRKDFLEVSELEPEKVWVLREGYCPNKGIFPFCSCQSDRTAVYKAGNIETLIKIVDENGGYIIMPELHVPLLRPCQQEHIHSLHNPTPTREIAFVVRKDFVRERLLNILCDAVKTIIPEKMLDESVKRFLIRI